MRIFPVLLVSALLLACGSGPVVWERVIDAEADEVAAGLATDGTRLAVLGTRTSPGGGSAWLLQLLSLDGRLRGSRLYDEGTTNVAGDAAMAANGDVLAVGTSRIEDREMCVVARYGAGASLVWHRALALGDEARGRGICRTADRVLVCGSVTAEGAQRLFIAALDSAGTTIWTRDYDLGPSSEARRIAADRDGNLAVCGRAGTAENPDILVAKFGPGGDTLWTRHYDSGGPDEPGGVAFDVFGNVLVTGTAGTDTPRCVILEYHPNGELIRRAAYTEEAQAEGRAIATTPDGDIFVTGRLLGAGTSALLAFQYEPNATSIWEQTLRRTGGDMTGIGLAVPGDVFVLVTVERPDASDMLLARFRRPTGAGG